MDSSLINLIVAVLFFIIGAAVVGLIWYFQAVMGKGRKGLKKSSPLGEDQTEIAHLIRDNKTQDLVVEMEGNTYKSVHELNPGQQRRLSFTSTVLEKWLTAPAPQPAPTGEAQEGSQEASAAVAVPIAEGTESPGAQAGFIAPFAEEPETAVTPVSTNLTDVVGGILNPAPQPPPQFKSIAMQINDILQAQLAGTALESRGITVNDAPDHGVMVTLDGNKYPGLKDVPDEDVRKAIRAAVLEWETRK